MSEIILNESNFGNEIEQHKGVSLVDFWAPWCMPCKMLAPAIEAIAEDYKGKVKVGKVNVDDNRSLAAKFGIMSIPTIIIFKEGKIADQIIGSVPKAVLESKLRQYISE